MITICKICGHNTLEYEGDTALSPEGYCEGCQEQVDNDRGDRECDFEEGDTE